MKSLLSTFVVSLGFMLIIIIIFDISEKFDDFLNTSATIGQIIGTYYVSFIPYMGMLLAPLFIFISVVVFTSRTAMRSEFVAILSSKVSIYRILLPYLITSTLLASVSWYGYHYALPNANKVRLEFENTYLRNAYNNTDTHIHFQDSPNTFVYFKSFNSRDSVGWQFSLEKFNEQGELYYKLRSPRVQWEGKKQSWRISNYTIRKIYSDEEDIKKGTVMDTSINITPKDFSRKTDYLENLTTPELEEFIAQERTKGSDMIANFEVKLYERNAFAFSIFILVIIGFSFSSKKVRGGIGIQIITALGIGIIYIFIQKVCTIYAANAGLSPILAVWFPNIFFALFAIRMLLKAGK